MTKFAQDTSVEKFINAFLLVEFPFRGCGSYIEDKLSSRNERSLWSSNYICFKMPRSSPWYANVPWPARKITVPFVYMMYPMLAIVPSLSEPPGVTSQKAILERFVGGVQREKRRVSMSGEEGGRSEIWRRGRRNGRDTRKLYRIAHLLALAASCKRVRIRVYIYVYARGCWQCFCIIMFALLFILYISIYMPRML